MLLYFPRGLKSGLNGQKYRGTRIHRLEMRWGRGLVEVVGMLCPQAPLNLTTSTQQSPVFWGTSRVCFARGDLDYYTAHNIYIHPSMGNSAAALRKLPSAELRGWEHDLEKAGTPIDFPPGEVARVPSVSTRMRTPFFVRSPRRGAVGASALSSSPERSRGRGSAHQQDRSGWIAHQRVWGQKRREGYCSVGCRNSGG